MELTEQMEQAGFEALNEYAAMKANSVFPRPSLIAHLWNRMTEASPCRICGNEERGQGGYLSCECHIHPGDGIPSDVIEAAWTALFDVNIVRTPHRKLFVLACARLVMAERNRASQRCIHGKRDDQDCADCDAMTASTPPQVPQHN